MDFHLSKFFSATQKKNLFSLWSTCCGITKWMQEILQWLIFAPNMTRLCLCALSAKTLNEFFFLIYHSCIHNVLLFYKSTVSSIFLFCANHRKWSRIIYHLYLLHKTCMVRSIVNLLSQNEIMLLLQLGCLHMHDNHAMQTEKLCF